MKDATHRESWKFSPRSLVRAAWFFQHIPEFHDNVVCRQKRPNRLRPIKHAVQTGIDWEKDEVESTFRQIEWERGQIWENIVVSIEVEGLILHIPPIFQTGHLAREAQHLDQHLREIQPTCEASLVNLHGQQCANSTPRLGLQFSTRQCPLFGSVLLTCFFASFKMDSTWRRLEGVVLATVWLSEFRW